MSHRNSKQERGVRMYKTLAQTVGVAASLFFLLFIIGEGIPDITAGKGGGLLVFLPFILVPIAGFILTWFKEWPGMFLLTAGGVALTVYFFIKGDITMGLVYGLPFIVTGLLFLLHLKKRHQLQHQHHQHK
jgi:hypothetical protein